MDSRKILEIYKRINDRSIKPVSDWPTVADIPPGMVVLDSDGTIWKKEADGSFSVISADFPESGIFVDDFGAAFIVDGLALFSEV